MVFIAEVIPCMHQILLRARQFAKIGVTSGLFKEAIKYSDLEPHVVDEVGEMILQQQIDQIPYPTLHLAYDSLDRYIQQQTQQPPEALMFIHFLMKCCYGKAPGAIY